MDENTEGRRKRLRIFILLTLVAGLGGGLLSLWGAVRGLVTFMETWGVSWDVVVTILALGLFWGIGSLILAKIDLSQEQAWKETLPLEVVVILTIGALLMVHTMMPTRSRISELAEILYYAMFGGLFFVIFCLAYKFRGVTSK